MNIPIRIYLSAGRAHRAAGKLREASLVRSWRYGIPRRTYDVERVKLAYVITRRPS